MVSIRLICLVTSCARSLSPVEITTSMPIISACLAKVPMTSSASTPGIAIKGNPSAFINSCSGAICPRKSSGIEGLLAL